MKYLLMVFLAMVLVNCDMTEPVPVVQTQTRVPAVPSALRQCADIPPVPGQNATNQDVGLYIVDLNEALEDCKGKHVALVEVIDAFKVRFPDSQAIEDPKG